jgi:hypothetical protein
LLVGVPIDHHPVVVLHAIAGLPTRGGSKTNQHRCNSLIRPKLSAKAYCGNGVFFSGNMMSDDGEKIRPDGVDPNAGLVTRLLEIIAAEGLIHPELLDSHAKVDEIGFTIDDLTLIGNAIEREFDCDMMPDESMQRCRTIRELVVLIGRRIQSAGAGV